LDFSNPAATARVNNWVSDATQGKIDKLFDALDPGIVTYLIDAVYFKGQWTLPFDPSQTQPMPFHLADGSEISVPAMTQAAEYAITSAANYSAVALPYGDGRMQMVIVLPNTGVELNSVLSELTPDAWQTLVGQLQDKTSVMVSLPRFKVEYEQVLNDALIKLGMPTAFSQTDFANMTDGGGLKISYVLHKAIVEVSEEGTEAAAVSVGAMTKGVLATQPFIVDHPFFFAIYDSTTGAILFMGTVYQPQSLDK
jgi:serine protease inhibitor